MSRLSFVFIILLILVYSNLSGQLSQVIYIDISKSTTGIDSNEIDRELILHTVDSITASPLDNSLIFISNGATPLIYGPSNEDTSQLAFNILSLNSNSPSPDKDLLTLFNQISKYNGLKAGAQFIFFLSNENCLNASNHSQVLLEKTLLAIKSRPGYERVSFHLYLTQGARELETIKVRLISSIQLHPLH